MKICWDSLRNIRLNSKGNLTDGKNIYIEIDACKKCGESFLALKYIPKQSLYCCNECAYTCDEWRKVQAKNQTGKPSGMKGQKHSEETKKLLSKERIGKKFSKEHRDNMSKGSARPFLGRKHSEESKKKMSLKRSKENNYGWKGGVSEKNAPWFDTFVSQIDYAEEIKKDADGLMLVKCTYCNRWYLPLTTDVTHRIRCLEGKDPGEKRFYCSEGCKQACPIYNRTKFQKGFKPETSREVQPELRQMVLERDNWTCQKCDKTIEEVELHCHHIEGLNQNPIESADVDNCLTLCKECHKEVHKLPGCKYYDLRCKESN